MQVKIDDVVDKIIDYRGKTPKKLGTNWKLSGIPAISAKNIKNGLIVREDTIRYVDENTYEKWMKDKVKAGDVLLTSEAPLGETYYVKTSEPFVLSQRLFALRTNPSKLDSRFFYLLSKTNRFKKTLQTYGTGATVSGIRQQLLWQLPIDIPDIKHQKKVADIVWNYDLLIENNLKRMNLLESMATQLYLHFYEGPMSKGAPRKPLLDFIELNPTVKVPKDGEKPFVPMGNIRENSMLIQSFSFRSGNSGSKFEAGDTLFARITPSLENGKTAYVHHLPEAHRVGFGSTEYIVMRSKKLSPEIVYLIARSEQLRKVAIKSMVGASGRQRVQEKCFAGLTLPDIGSSKLEELIVMLQPIFDEINFLHDKNTVLSNTRDLISPKLMSGEVKV